MFGIFRYHVVHWYVYVVQYDLWREMFNSDLWYGQYYYTFGYNFVLLYNPRKHGINGYMNRQRHYNDVIMDSMASQITSLTIVYTTVYSATDQRKHQISASLAFVRGIHRGPVNSPHKWPVTRKMFPFDDIIMNWYYLLQQNKAVCLFLGIFFTVC